MLHTGDAAVPELVPPLQSAPRVHGQTGRDMTGVCGPPRDPDTTNTGRGPLLVSLCRGSSRPFNRSSCEPRGTWPKEPDLGLASTSKNHSQPRPRGVLVPARARVGQAE